MSCSHLRGLGSLVAGNPGYVGHRVVPLSEFANYSCINTTDGPTISMRCSNCQILRDVAYVSWQFVDLPNNPVTAVGFVFKLTARDHADQKHLSFVRGTLKNGSLNDRPATFRGEEPNILKFNFFPRIYKNMQDLKLIQPLFYEFLPGSSITETSQLQASLQRPSDGLINTTLSFNFLSDYIVEIDRQNILGPVSFLADLGGLYCISIAIFFYLMVQCEYRIKKLRHEDNEMRKIRNRRKAQDHWEKLRKYVMFTWAPCALEDKYDNVENDACCGVVTKKSSRKGGSSHKKNLSKADEINFSRKANLPSEKKTAPEHNLMKVDEAHLREHALKVEESNLTVKDESIQENGLSKMIDCRKQEPSSALPSENGCQNQTSLGVDMFNLPPPPSVEGKANEEISMTDLQKNLENLCEYNAMLTERLNAAQSMFNALTRRNATSTGVNHPKL